MAANECRMSDLRVVRDHGEDDRSLGFAEATYRTMGILAGGWGHNVEYLRGVENVLTATLNRVREAIGAAETRARQCSTCGAIHADVDCFGAEVA